MPITLEVVSLPGHDAGTVRRALKLRKRDWCHYTTRRGDEVMLTRDEVADGHDALLGQFLDLSACDITSRPERLQAVDADLAQQLNSLVSGTEVDFDLALSAEDE